MTYTLEQMDEFYKNIADRWNTFAKKKANKDCIVTENAVLDVILLIGEKAFIECIQNYEMACRLPNSQAWHFNLYRFAKTGFYKFRPGAFDIDNYDKSKFRPETKDKIHEAMDYE